MTPTRKPLEIDWGLPLVLGILKYFPEVIPKMDRIWRELIYTSNLTRQLKWQELFSGRIKKTVIRFVNGPFKTRNWKLISSAKLTPFVKENKVELREMFHSVTLIALWHILSVLNRNSLTLLFLTLLTQYNWYASPSLTLFEQIVLYSNDLQVLTSLRFLYSIQGKYTSRKQKSCEKTWTTLGPRPGG